MNILMFNSNTTPEHTAIIDRVARASASPTTAIVTRMAAFGPRYINSRSEAAIAAHATLEGLAACEEPVSAAVISAFVDPGLMACRELLPFPVVGIAEAAMLTASFLGARYAIVTTGARVAPVFWELARAYGAATRLVAVEALDDDVDPIGNPAGAAAALAQAARRCIRYSHAEVIVLGGAPFADLRHLVQAQLDVPVIEGVSCGVRMAEALAGLGVTKATTGSLSHPGPRQFTAMGGAAVRRFGAPGST